jgi:cytochrome c oxidase assembly protein subunit 15
LKISMSRGQRWFGHFAALLLGYLLFVIVFGAWVRITGSGAGCGDHWPSCQGVLLPRTPSQATLIEYSHRLSSGLLGVAALALPVWAFRCFSPGHATRRWSVWTLLLVAVEAAIGAGLVKNRLVADDASLARAVVVALHLVNTLLLTASAALTAMAAREARRTRARQRTRSTAPRAPLDWLSLGVLIGLGLVAASGAVTALGDTLFPVGTSFREGSEHFLVQLRVLHPILACALVVAALGLARLLANLPGVRPFALALGGLALLQLGLGAMNVLLRAPGWLQLAHLLIAQLFWLSAVLAARGFWSPSGLEAQRLRGLDSGR